MTGSIESAIAGEYDFSIKTTFSDAWAKTKGSKGTIWLAVLYVMIGAFIVVGILEFLRFSLGIASGTVANTVPDKDQLSFEIISQLILTILYMPLAGGLFMIGLKLAVGAPVKATEIFGYYHKVWPIIVFLVLLYLILICGFLLLIIPGIYLAVAYIFAFPLLIEKNLSPWQALETSRKVVTRHWFKVFGFYLAIMLIILLAMIPLGIGLIWALPLVQIAFGLLYSNIFGYESSTG